MTVKEAADIIDRRRRTRAFADDLAGQEAIIHQLHQLPIVLNLTDTALRYLKQMPPEDALASVIGAALFAGIEIGKLLQSANGQNSQSTETAEKSANTKEENEG